MSVLSPGAGNLCPGAANLFAARKHSAKHAIFFKVTKRIVCIYNFIQFGNSIWRFPFSFPPGAGNLFSQRRTGYSTT
ncbi:MAG TPA: hypothetical protein PKC30_08465 [Saprospiraceae bacterium]|nr:hypothetical protein [Saprospiraceae bacterium]